MPADASKHSPSLPAPVQQWWVYMVRAENGHLYTGISTDPQRRLLQHQRGLGARFFNRSPAQALVWQQRCADHGDALRQERAIKALTKKAKERLISQFNDALSRPANDCAGPHAATKLTSS